MKRLAIVALLFFLGFVGVAHAENVYDMKYQGYLIKAHGPSPGSGFPSDPFFDPIPIEQISNDNLTFSGNAALMVDNPYTFNPSTCCSLNLGNQGSFTVAFDNPVYSVGLDLFPISPRSGDAIQQLNSSTVSAVYRNDKGEIVGESSVTANWLFSRDWQWDNTFNNHESYFGVSSVDGFSEVTFTVDGMEGIFMGRDVVGYSDSLSLGSTQLYYSYVNPVPEPQTYAMLLAGFGLLAFMTKRRRKSGN